MLLCTYRCRWTQLVTSASHRTKHNRSALQQAGGTIRSVGVSWCPLSLVVIDQHCDNLDVYWAYDHKLSPCCSHNDTSSVTDSACYSLSVALNNNTESMLLPILMEHLGLFSSCEIMPSFHTAGISAPNRLSLQLLNYKTVIKQNTTECMNERLTTTTSTLSFCSSHTEIHANISGDKWAIQWV